MKISFKPLSVTDFENLLIWLQQPHVKKWWDTDVNYTKEAIQEKYGTYVNGFKRIGSERKPIHAFIIYFDDDPIGYIQYYNAYDFRQCGHQLDNLPNSLAGVDMFIGDEHYLGKGVGSKSLELFLDSHVFSKFDYAFVDPDSSNLAAIKTYENVGFRWFGKDQKYMLIYKILPPWIKYPDYPPTDSFWRQSGEYYLQDLWHQNLLKFSPDDKTLIFTLYPEPEKWKLVRQMQEWISNEDVLLELSNEEESLVLQILNSLASELTQEELMKYADIKSSQLSNAINNYQEEKAFYETYIVVKNSLSYLSNKQLFFANKSEFKSIELNKVKNLYSKISKPQLIQVSVRYQTLRFLYENVFQEKDNDIIKLDKIDFFRSDFEGIMASYYTQIYGPFVEEKFRKYLRKFVSLICPLCHNKWQTRESSYYKCHNCDAEFKINNTKPQIISHRGYFKFFESATLYEDDTASIICNLELSLASYNFFNLIGYLIPWFYKAWDDEDTPNIVIKIIDEAQELINNLELLKKKNENRNYVLDITEAEAVIFSVLDFGYDAPVFPTETKLEDANKFTNLLQLLSEQSITEYDVQSNLNLCTEYCGGYWKSSGYIDICPECNKEQVNAHYLKEADSGFSLECAFYDLIAIFQYLTFYENSIFKEGVIIYRGDEIEPTIKTFKQRIVILLLQGSPDEK